MGALHIRVDGHDAAPPRSDFRLVPLAAVVWLATIVVPALPAMIAEISIVVLALPAAVAVVAGRWPGVALVLVGAAVGAAISALHVAAARAGPVSGLAADAAVVTVELSVRTDPRPKQSTAPRRAPYVVFEADIRWIRGRGIATRVDTPVVVVGSERWFDVLPGQRVRAVARLASTDLADRATALVAARSPPTIVEQPGVVARAANQLRAGLRQAVAPLPEAERGLLPALVVGDVSGLKPQLVEDLRSAGMSHLTAVSGTNLTILLVFVLGIARWAGLRSWGIPLLGIAVVAGFVVLARPEPSVLRAAAMGLVGLIGLAAGTRRHGLPALAIAVIGLLLVDPWLGRSFGFALSVSATAGILVLGPPCTNVLAARMPGWLASAIAIPIAAQIACTPLVVMLSGEVSIVAVAANVLAAPVVAPATVLGVIATLLSSVSGALASGAAWLAFPAVSWIVEVATRGADLPGAGVTWSTSPMAIAVLVACCGALAITAPVVLRRKGSVVLLSAALLLWLINPIRMPAAPGWITAWPPDGWLLMACDVGQGDALVLRAAEGIGVVVDTGPDPAAVDRCLSELGIHTVPYVLLTHFHADHIGGLAGVLAGRDIGEVGIRPRSPPSSRHAIARVLPRRTGDGRSADPRIDPVDVGERRRVGDVTWTVLGPATGTEVMEESRGSGDVEDSAENDSSVVALAEVRGVRILLTGDIEPAAQRALLRSGQDLRVDVLKVPHHGSRFQDPEFLARAGARLAIVSAGADNDYGHPASSTLDVLAANGQQVARTDQEGAIAVVDGPGGLTVVRQRSPPAPE